MTLYLEKVNTVDRVDVWEIEQKLTVESKSAEAQFNLRS
jgi:hypothetical protein